MQLVLTHTAVVWFTMFEEACLHLPALAQVINDGAIFQNGWRSICSWLTANQLLKREEKTRSEGFSIRFFKWTHTSEQKSHGPFKRKQFVTTDPWRSVTWKTGKPEEQLCHVVVIYAEDNNYRSQRRPFRLMYKNKKYDYFPAKITKSKKKI